MNPIIPKERFGRLVAIERCGKSRYGVLWKCVCDCGRETMVPACKLRSGNTKSCGCGKLEAGRQNGKKNAVHGLSRVPVGISWQAMMNRCYNERQPGYSSYGAAGITACEFIRESPANLLSLIGHRPPGMSLDRIDNDLGYYCGTCKECALKGWPRNVRWATRTQQNRNRSDAIILTIGDKSRNIHEWSEDYGVSVRCILHRIEAGKRDFELLAPSRCKH